ncbi:MAG: hypothetical protein ACOYO1_12885 [Bacteroidales bacterium]
MQEIEIKYWVLWFNSKKKRMIPSCWMEVNAIQLIAIAEHYLGSSDEFNLLAALCGVKKKIIQRMPDFFRMKLAEAFEFIKDYKPYNTFILKKVQQLHAPKSKLEAMSFGQFMFADTFYNDWCRHENTEDLNKIVASLYLPENSGFSEKCIAENLVNVSKLDKKVKYAITLNYRLVKEWLCEKYPLIFERPEMDEKKKRKTGRTGNGWVTIFENIVGDDIIHADNYAKLPLHTVLRFLTKKIKEHAKNKHF